MNNRTARGDWRHPENLFLKLSGVSQNKPFKFDAVLLRIELFHIHNPFQCLPWALWRGLPTASTNSPITNGTSSSKESCVLCESTDIRIGIPRMPSGDCILRERLFPGKTITESLPFKTDSNFVGCRYFPRITPSISVTATLAPAFRLF